MRFMDKLNNLRTMYITDAFERKIKSHLLIKEGRAPKEFLAHLKSLYPTLPPSYLEFLKFFDGIVIDWITLYGSPFSEIISLLSRLDLYTQTMEINFIEKGYCPIGEDAGADLYCLNQAGKIIMFDSENPEEPEQIVADTFESFMDDCVLGKRYAERSIEGSAFHQFLILQGWA